MDVPLWFPLFLISDSNIPIIFIKEGSVSHIGLIIAFFVIPILVYIVKVNDGKWDDNSSVRSVVYSKTATISGTRSISPSSSGNGYSYNANIEEITQEIKDN